MKWMSCQLRYVLFDNTFIILSFICSFKKKYSSTYANSVNFDQTPHVSGPVMGLHGEHTKELSMQILSKF